MAAPDVDGTDAVLVGGGLVNIRPIRASDLPGLHDLHSRASDGSMYRRYFSLNREAGDRYLSSLVASGPPQHHALVASAADQVVGVAMFERIDDGSAEVALLVADDQQHTGIGTLLLEHLAAAARQEGIGRFVAEVLTNNSAMIGVFRDLGYLPTMTFEGGEVHVAFDLAVTAAVMAAMDSRDARADAASLQPILAPRSLVVVGASPRVGSIGHELLANIVTSGYTGRVYAVNPHQTNILGVPSFPTPLDLPEAPDLAVVAVPAGQVLGVVRSLGERGTRGLVLISSGFGETGTQGKADQDEVVATARRHGMRLVGPNCLGLLNTDPSVRLNATFASMPMTPGSLGLISQSGALGIAVLAAAADCGLATSQFVSVGNKADVSSNDLLLAWEHDDRTRVIALYLESFGNPRKFARIARRVAQRKPVIAIKAGRSMAGQRAGTSHTAAAAASDVVVDALFSQAGVIRVGTMQQMLDASRVLSDQPLPAGPRVAIIGNSGGPGILAADAAESAGLTVIELTAGTQSALRVAAPGAASSQNPVDLGAGAGADSVTAALEVLLQADEVDSVLAVFTDTAVTSPEEVMTRIAQAAAKCDKPVVATRVGAPATSIPMPGSSHALPVFTFPEPAAEALALARRYAQIQARPLAEPHRPTGIDGEPARAVIAAALALGQEWLSPGDCEALLTAYGVPICPQRVVTDATAAAKAGAELGYPLAVKLAGGGTHKTEVGGVRLGVEDEAALLVAFAELQAVQPSSAGVLLQAMAQSGLEVIVGAIQDELVGPVVMLGVGGVLSDLIADRTFGLAPLAAGDAEAMVARLRLSRLLDGYRGGVSVSRPALGDLVARVAALAADHPEVAELDLNPVIGNGDQLVAVDARIRIAVPASKPDPTLRQLR
jgi:acyl-CoA synthetase (NDP forming)/ribosomal protein S18 acetylase RimI-like enzyme